MNNIYIITGVSRGIGEALAKRLLQPSNRVIGISRKANEQLAAWAEKQEAAYEFFPYDLKETQGLDALLERVFAKVNKQETSSVTFINNAGMLEPIMPLQEADSQVMTEHLQVNLLAPMICTAAFIRLTEGWEMPRTIVNISSGAGKHPYSGWAAYCTSKAGLDMLTRCVALEQGEGAHAVKLLSIAPGIVDTQMQELIRSTPEASFPDVNKFIELKATDALTSPEDAADRIAGVLESGRFQQGDVIDLRQLYA
ncbi:(S)-benzoin forming benzil reductase [Paenibacillus cremeus]|uniref:(S)-benzoin forming benzil reductase n=1 Tax=Paenibacillus cremeus TaxID=2163881 RepID=A0A559K538_9BACL|nr:(S)-benzoin forming benzil reductase [Paenibacillus cremeus]TVY07261.1 (S)-benzoin forming benzil reductase [Paenibacillus cremeus]